MHTCGMRSAASVDGEIVFDADALALAAAFELAAQRAEVLTRALLGEITVEDATLAMDALLEVDPFPRGEVS